MKGAAQTSNPPVTYAGGCHCGEIRFVYSTSVAPKDWNVRSCQCSFCRSHGARTTSDPSGSVRFTTGHRTLRYRFALGTADFLICASCGVYVAAVLTSAAGTFATVNLNALATEPAEAAASTPAHYGAESAAERIARRERMWTPCEIVV